MNQHSRCVIQKETISTSKFCALESQYKTTLRINVCDIKYYEVIFCGVSSVQVIDLNSSALSSLTVVLSH